MNADNFYLENRYIKKIWLVLFISGLGKIPKWKKAQVGKKPKRKKAQGKKTQEEKSPIGNKPKRKKAQ